MKFYHFTYPQHVSRILTEGLKPGIETGNHNEYLLGSGDPNYIYLWSNKVIKLIGILAILEINPAITTRNTILLEVDLDKTSVERDYDQLLYLYRQMAANSDIEKRFNNTARALGVTLFEETSEADIIVAINNVPEESWVKKPGSYRIKEMSTLPRIVSWKTVIPFWIRMINFIVRPILQRLTRSNNTSTT
ncbi:MAG: hypothetical protein A3A80_03570 [Candidatus Terrybacteria bacterium RIFCSPLOWO2_01_FULL_44_24]|uniref:Uncharacterized protein n=1 Tax=Candidatus Terrybacteria bacterium RIFCSPHIGHO2_01_FULL_43_35 TaxID=1802361 RepID=A0A1G2PDJ0_9BACT|nr:MAG: hypothetical protein A2828_00490 [Candidatus Terrybacteria bacterium RIFCSPHIGHO2_01_FULL_43_35]OHA49761.1 MAG: hypothetical protein A3B75_02065 [Candidatus Terrybacteria bacterium RIFCSPHIGHO2_02_FULL_43_14]OHA51583.1 MAG: hypothetical protein A3A80_03570 [Candidatus Terrybacteria bacterium RIFCSPLOWO2_01_FULL_44_24]